MTSLLALNAGSSSLKFALYNSAGLAELARGKIEEVGPDVHLIIRGADGTVLDERRWEGRCHEDVLPDLLEWVEFYPQAGDLAAAGHRVVHGGARFTQPVLLDTETITALEELSPLAILHQPQALRPIAALKRLRPGLQQVACFDTAFHHTLAPAARRIALPRALEEQGVRKYGFHGLSYDYIAGCLHEVAPELARGRVIAAHLGSGASLCAMRDGKSVDTTMGFSPLEGLVMATRPGSLDAGVLLYLLDQGWTARQLQDLLYHRSGLLGVSGLSGDMRTLEESGDARAGEAIDLFIFRLNQAIGAMAASLGGVDGIVFTGGIGENSVAIRKMACEQAAWLGLSLDEAANAAGAGRISLPDSHVAAWVIPTDEELVIARQTASLLRV
jgi:acetate kinase